MNKDSLRYRDLNKDQQTQFKELAKSKGYELPKGYATCGAAKFTKIFAEVMEIETEAPQKKNYKTTKYTYFEVD